MILRLLGKAAGKVADILEPMLEPMAENACAELRAEQLARKQHAEELEQRLSATLTYCEELEEANGQLTAELENERKRCDTQAEELRQLGRQYGIASQAANGWREQCTTLREDTKAHANELVTAREAHRAIVTALSDNSWIVLAPNVILCEATNPPKAEIWPSLDAARRSRATKERQKLWDLYEAKIK